jgi:ATP-dependent phosphoenolpyruvate carboxykinase
MINTGWVNGDFKSGSRIEMEKTRKTIEMIQSGKLSNVKTKKDTIFGFNIPYLSHLENVENYPYVKPSWFDRANHLKRKFNE